MGLGEADGGADAGGRALESGRGLFFDLAAIADAGGAHGQVSSGLAVIATLHQDAVIRVSPGDGSHDLEIDVGPMDLAGRVAELLDVHAVLPVAHPAGWRALPP